MSERLSLDVVPSDNIDTGLPDAGSSALVSEIVQTQLYHIILQLPKKNWAYKDLFKHFYSWVY